MRLLLSPWIISALNAVSVISWSYLYAWYGLPHNYERVRMGFGNIPDYLNSLPYLSIPLIFLIISFTYILTYLYLRNTKNISAEVITVVVTSGVIALAINFFLYPIGAQDVYNYIIELKLAFYYHLNPYTNVFLPFVSDPVAKFGFFYTTPLFYGPVWLIVSSLPTYFTGFEDAQKVMLGLKALNLILLILTAWIIYLYHIHKRERLLGVYLFLANPVVLFEGLGNAHNDVMMTYFLVLALLALKRKFFLSVAFFTLSFLVKFFTLPLLPLLLHRAYKQLGKSTFFLAIGCAAVIGIWAVSMFWERGGILAGLRKGTQISQTFSNISLSSIVREAQWIGKVHINTIIFTQIGFVFLFLAGVVFFYKKYRRDNALERQMINIYLLFCILITLLYQWYLFPFFAIIAMAPFRKGLVLLFFLVTVSLFLYPFSFWAWFDIKFNPLITHMLQAVFYLFPIMMYLCSEIVPFKGTKIRNRLSRLL